MTISRPLDLGEVVSARGVDIWVPLAEFMDEFYMAHGDTEAQQHMVDVEPHLTGDDQIDGYIAAVAEHLALRWNLDVPPWTEMPERMGSPWPLFRPDMENMRSQYLVESPYSFRRRNIFTGREPLQRARWPTDVAKVQSLF